MTLPRGWWVDDHSYRISGVPARACFYPEDDPRELVVDTVRFLWRNMGPDCMRPSVYDPEDEALEGRKE